MIGGRTGWVIVGLVLLGAGIWWLRSATMATYPGTAAGTQSAVSFEIATSGTPSSEAANARALLWPCIADVGSRLVGDISRVDGERFRVVLQPALDVSERKKFLGCLRDTRVAHVRAAAVEIDRIR